MFILKAPVEPCSYGPQAEIKPYTKKESIQGRTGGGADWV